jgi:adenylate kinase
MFSPRPRVTEQDFRRFLTDQESRHELGALAQKRALEVQQLMAKLYLLSDDEFENALQTVSAIVDSSLAKKTVDKKFPGNPNKVLSEVESRVIQNQRKTA